MDVFANIIVPELWGIIYLLHLDLVKLFEEQGIIVHISNGQFQTVLGLVGDVSAIDSDMLRLLDIVQDVKSRAR